MAFIKTDSRHLEYLDTILAVTADYGKDSISLNALLEKLEKVFGVSRRDEELFQEIRDIFYAYIYAKPSTGKGGDSYYIVLDSLRKLKMKLDK